MQILINILAIIGAASVITSIGVLLLMYRLTLLRSPEQEADYTLCENCPTHKAIQVPIQHKDSALPQ